MRELPRFAWTHSDVSLQQEMLLIFECLKQNSAIFDSFFTGNAFGADRFHKSQPRC